MRHIKNLDRWYKVVDANDAILFEGEQLRTVEVALNTVGPAVVRLFRLIESAKGWTPDKSSEILLGVIEGYDGLRFSASGNFCLSIEPSGEAWIYRDMSPVAMPLDPDRPSMTRFEKGGLYVDELGIALHRQAVLSRLAAAQVTDDRDRYTRELETRLSDLAARVTALTPVATPQSEQAEE